MASPLAGDVAVVKTLPFQKFQLAPPIRGSCQSLSWSEGSDRRFLIYSGGSGRYHPTSTYVFDLGSGFQLPTKPHGSVLYSSSPAQNSHPCSTVPTVPFSGH
ncbi:hypothetical protein CRENBAI_005255 [Crenichthys baileyi]|uniref:Uncharacterized protein n=1 Tax=Crenichthys baileyi TaxID=28760 RepID=A0AAV9RBL8_9TELE